MIHVCSLARLHDTVEATGARHVVTLMRHVDRVQRPCHRGQPPHVAVDDITVPMDGYVASRRGACAAADHFVQRWDRTAPLVVHCYAGISRSTASAFAAACVLNPQRDELRHRLGHPRASPTATAQFPHRLARRPAARTRRPHDPVQSTYRPRRCGTEGHPFRLDLL